MMFLDDLSRRIEDLTRNLLSCHFSAQILSQLDGIAKLLQILFLPLIASKVLHLEAAIAAAAAAMAAAAMAAAAAGREIPLLAIKSRTLGLKTQHPHSNAK